MNNRLFHYMRPFSLTSIAVMAAAAAAVCLPFHSHRLQPPSLSAPHGIEPYLTEGEAVRLFDQLASRRDLVFGYTDDGCYVRAEIMKNALHEKGYKTGKIWVFSREKFRNLETDSIISSKVKQEREEQEYDMKDLVPVVMHPPGFPDHLFKWGYHVAVTLRVAAPDGVIRNYVFDPSLFDGPVTIDQWVSIMPKGQITPYQITYGDTPPRYAMTGYTPNIKSWTPEAITHDARKVMRAITAKAGKTGKRYVYISESRNRLCQHHATYCVNERQDWIGIPAGYPSAPTRDVGYKDPKPTG